jgi:hypothetical protein
MFNRDVFINDPVSLKIPNDGVTNIYNPKTPNDWDVVQYELRSFVCEGEYERGLDRILSTFLGSLDKPKQPAAWVSGFYGSGKSHLVKVLQYLWSDVELPDGARARSLVTLPKEIQDLLKELTTAGKRYGGLWSAAGKLTAAQDTSVRMGLLGILFQCAGLPEKYHLARFVMWLKQEGLYDSVKSYVESQGDTFGEELINLYVSKSIVEGLLKAYPTFADKPADARKILIANYPEKQEISDEDFLQAVENVLELQQETPGKLPLSLIVFDELQQFLGDEPDRINKLQTAVETVSSRLGSKVLFVGTGQASLQATANLSRLQDRFTVKVMLEDSDVETVVRKVILQKRADKITDIENVLDTYRAEIDRQLVGTNIAPMAIDNSILVADYPLLPTRRRFWERVLRAIDTAGTAAQLRTQLRIVQEANALVAALPLGTVVPADIVYDQQEASMLQGSVLLREVATIIKSLDDGTSDGRLKQRLSQLVFLIGKLPTEGAAYAAIKSDADTLADLLVDDLTKGSASLRQRIPVLLNELVEKATLMKIGDEYRLQTAEAARWDEDFRKRFTSIRNDDTRIASDRGSELQKAVSAELKGITLTQGVSKTPRKYQLNFGGSMPKVENNQVPIWVQNEWDATESSVKSSAQEAGIDNPVIFVLLPKRSANDLRDRLAEYHAAKEVLDTRPNPTTTEGYEARRAMEARMVIAKQNLDKIVSSVLDKARLFQGGGNEEFGSTFSEIVQNALEDSLARMFNKFNIGDHAKWDDVLKKAQEGAQDALRIVGYQGNAGQNPVCQEILTYVGAGKKGSDIRKNFMGIGYGWPQDAIDAALMTLKANDLVYTLQNGQQVKNVTQAQIGITEFRQQDAPVTVPERIAIRGLLNDLGITYKPNSEDEVISAALLKLTTAQQDAGGPPPLPEKPGSNTLIEIQALSGNKQMKAIAAAKTQLCTDYKDWTELKGKKDARSARWNDLQRLQKHAVLLPVANETAPQIQAILNGRTLLSDPDPVTPLINRLVDALRKALLGACKIFNEKYQELMDLLEKSDAWKKIDASQRQGILDQCGLSGLCTLMIGTEQELLNSLDTQSVAGWEDRIKALPARFIQATLEAMKLLAPQAVQIKPPSATLKTVDDVESYLKTLGEQILPSVNQGITVIIQ